MRGWQADYAHVWAAGNIRAMPENEIPPAKPVDHYSCLKTVHDAISPDCEIFILSPQFSVMI